MHVQRLRLFGTAYAVTTETPDAKELDKQLRAVLYARIKDSFVLGDVTREECEELLVKALRAAVKVTVREEGT